jgi:LemA protein
MFAILLIVIVLIGALVAAPGMIWVSTNNRLVALDTRCDTAFADIDAHLKHRQNHEAHILDGITQARVEAMRAIAPDMKLKAEKNLTQQINALLGVADRYPELQASGHFASLRNELIDAENRITASRRFYNLAVGEYDTTLRQFSGSLIAQKRNMNPRTPFDLGFERVLIDEPMAIAF